MIVYDRARCRHRSPAVLGEFMSLKMGSLVALAFATLTIPAFAAAGTPGSAVATTVRSEVSMLMELHNMLQVASKGPEDSLPTYSLEVAAYRKAREMSKNPEVWELVNDACVLSKDLTGIRETAANLPSNLQPADREATLKLLSALETAWPRFEAKEMVDRNRSLQTVVTKTLGRLFGTGPAERVLVAVQDKMILKPLDAPVTIYPVISAIEAGDWGITPKGYYIVIPVRGRPTMIIAENVIHELTHLLDVNQPKGSSSMLTRLRQKGATADQGALEAFLHGLVAWNAGEMIKRFISPAHKAVIDLSPQVLQKMEPYLPIYSSVWVSYLDGKSTADQTVDAMITAFAKVPVPKPAPATPEATPAN